MCVCTRTHQGWGRKEGTGGGQQPGVARPSRRKQAWAQAGPGTAEGALNIFRASWGPWTFGGLRALTWGAGAGCVGMCVRVRKRIRTCVMQVHASKCLHCQMSLWKPKFAWAGTRPF